MRLSKYITTNGFEPEQLKECVAFHDTTKIKPFSSVKTFLRSSQYVDSTRGVEETSRNYRNYNAPWEDLGDARLPSTGFDQINERRCSTREYDPNAPFDRSKLLATLKSCCESRFGITPYSETAKLGFRGYASAGGLFPVDIYMLERDGDEFTLRYLNPRTSHLFELHTFGPEHHSMLTRALCDGNHDLLHTTQGVFILSAVWERSIVKYGRQGYRFAVMELGIVAHHLSMCLTAMEVDNLHWGGGFDDLVGEIVGIDPRAEAVGHLLWYGARSG